MNKIIKITIGLIFLSIVIVMTTTAQPSGDEPILIGAQVFVEPGQTDAETESWFRTMKENGMGVCRIRMFESYMLQPDGTWDFSLFDRAFKMAEKYGIKVMGTFFPSTEKTDIGGWKFPKDQQQLESFAKFIKQSVLHFKQFKSLYAWVLINEPGGGLKDNEFSRQMLADWKKKNPQPEYLENGYPVLVDLQEGRFKNYMTSWMLNWIAGEVRKYDPEIPLHVNPHAIFDNLPEYDFPYYRTFLNSLGGSAHASWHFGMFTRQQYPLAMSANCEILLSGAGNLPWLMTELQGGNNTYSAHKPMCPTAGEITQWLWTVFATQGKGGIFWSLNARASGVESGEWALLDFQGQPTARVEAIKKIAGCLDKNKDLFANMKKVDPGVNLLYFRESIWAEDAISQNRPSASDGRKTVVKNLLGYFKALSAMGINPNIKAFEEFDFSKEDYSGTAIVLAQQISLPSAAVEKLEYFVARGGKLFIDGLTGYYNEYVHNWMLTGFPLEKLFGGKVSEFCYLPQPEVFNLVPGNQIKAELWKGYLKPNEKSTILSKDADHITAIRSAFASGEVIWIPALLGLGAWDNPAPLGSFLFQEFKLSSGPFTFRQSQKNIIMKTLKSGNSLITVIISKEENPVELGVNISGSAKKSKILFTNGGGTIQNDIININPEETMVIEWN